MLKTSTIQTRIDPIIKKNVQKILNQLNMSMSEAISIYFSQIALHNGIPFEIKIPNELTAKTLKNSENMQDLHTANSVEKLFEKLDS